MDLKVCGVCGDKALNYNFNAVTCESCKAFFRRNALTSKVFKCPFESKCDINTVTRRFCQKCRLEKCFRIGMQKEMIMSDEDKELKRLKVEENKALKRSVGMTTFKRDFKKVRKTTDTTSTNSNSADEASNASMSPESVIDNMQDAGKKSDDNNLHTLLHTLIAQQTSKSTNTEQVNANSELTWHIIEDVHNNRIESNSMESILCEAIKLEFDVYSSLAQNRGPSRELNDAERAKLNELIVANKALCTPVDDDLANVIGADYNRMKGSPDEKSLSDPALVDVINLTAVAIRRLIKMAKKINAFKNMCQEDQIALLKGGCTEMMILRSVMNYDPNKQTWKIPCAQEYMGNLRTDVLKKAKGNAYQEHERFIATFDQRWRDDENIILILCAITLFTPNRARAVHVDVIKLEQNSYYYLLRRYLESVYPGCEAKSTFLKLIQKISELHKLNEEVINCYLDVNPSDVEPLLIEIFDLKH